jgi:hypothetical protein
MILVKSFMLIRILRDVQAQAFPGDRRKKDAAIQRISKIEEKHP